jgi:pre-mRNA-splicing factor ISY1
MLTNLRRLFTKLRAEWEEAHAHLREVLGLPSDDSSIPPIPRGTSATSSSISSSEKPPLALSDGKRKASDEDSTPAPQSDSEVVKRSKPDASVPTPSAVQPDAAATALSHARAAAAYIPFLSVESLLPPKMPTKEEMEGVLLELRKRMLVEEYFGN